MGRLRRSHVLVELTLPGVALAAVAALGLAVAGCQPAAAVVAAPALAHARNDGFWWLHTGDQSAAVACFGPTIEMSEGRFRPWSLVVHLPGSDEQLSCTQGLVPLDGMDPILSQGETFRVELRPGDGLLWGDVSGEAQLAASAEGLY